MSRDLPSNVTQRHRPPCDFCTQNRVIVASSLGGSPLAQAIKNCPHFPVTAMRTLVWPTM